jgi:hypothetical protein
MPEPNAAQPASNKIRTLKQAIREIWAVYSTAVAILGECARCTLPKPGEDAVAHAQRVAPYLKTMYKFIEQMAAALTEALQILTLLEFFYPDFDPDCDQDPAVADGLANHYATARADAKEADED